MRILHTSDWHLGQNFFTKSRKDEHQAFLAWLLELTEEKSIDAIIVAGDVFDTGTPPSYAREMYNQFVVDLNQRGCTLIVLGGNHDSVSTLNESKQLLSCLNTYVVASTSDDLQQQLIELKSREGETGALLCAVPFIRARDVMQSFSGDSAKDKQKQLAEAIEDHYQRLFALALETKQKRNLQVPVIATGHLTALGVTKTESERDIYIGTLDGFSSEGFPPADYIALGHIHRPQIVAKSEHIRYSGSPIPLSFDELKSQKQVVLVEFKHEERKAISTIDVPMFRNMTVIKGDLAEIEEQLAQISGDSEQATWVSVLVSEQDYLSDLQQRVQEMTEGLNVEVIQLLRERNTRNHTLEQQVNETLSELSVQDVFERRVNLESFEGEEEQERLSRITQTFLEVVHEVEVGGDE
ncbi:exonuclease subunit SbcD [Vibrio sp. JC009]|uniref:exonuclease subunit SbcD n=1 Tax=Vibrio sp. JC009 TaxID=2912314 RepID=UPI0023B089F5|nr:exonuclease subunit SbcD [Vibrio sp. JC009]WED23859.1 exonuclease subunit SbcD [Vibrio sp. JC009]